MASAALLYETKRVFADGQIAEARIWIVPDRVPGSEHWLKYSLFYGGANGRLVGYDNEAGKGDHRHYGDLEEPYAFTTVEQLVTDFLADISGLRGDDL